MASRKGWTGRVLIGAVAAMVLIALAAVPSFGASKKFTLDVKPNSAFAGVKTDYTFTIKNTTPGNSTINSVSIATPTDPAVPAVLAPFALQSPLTTGDVSIVSGSSTNPNSSASVSIVGSQVRVQNIDSLKTNQTITIKVSATFADPSPGSCTTPTEAWNVTAYAGNSLSGDMFTNQGTLAQKSLTLSSVSCIHLQFVDGRGPHDAIQGQTITSTDLNTPPGQAVQVALMANGTPVDITTSGDAVSLSISSFNGKAVPQDTTAPGVLTGNTSDFTNGVASFPSLKISNASPTPPTAGGDYQLKASYLSYPSVASDTFQIFDALICGAGSGQEVTYTEDSQVTSGDVTIQTNNNDCFAIIVDNNDLRQTGTGNIEEWSVTKSTTGVMKGTLTFNWDLGTSTTPVKWTQVTWDGLDGVYHDVQLCIPGVPFDQQFPPAPPGSDYQTEEMCLLTSSIGPSEDGTHYVQTEQVAYNTDYGGRK